VPELRGRGVTDDLDGLIAAAKAGPRVVLFDLERLPGEFTRDIWEPRDLARLNYLHPDQWTKRPATLCASWLVYGEKRPGFVAAWENPDDPWHVARTMRGVLHGDSTVAVTFNGRRADLKWLRQDWAQAQIPTPRPFKDIDLFLVARAAFALESKSLAYLADFLGLPGKHGRYDAAEAKAAAAGDEKAQRRLKRYSVQDSRLMAPVLDRLRPYIRGGPNLGIPHLDDERRCPVCGGPDLVRDGWTYTGITAFAAYHCTGCGSWSRSKHRRHSVEMRHAL
jgi:hypothetical protein